MRIIGGVWRSRLLTVVDLPSLRPTTDRIRETVFNWLGQDLTGLYCLDLFAGTGALGFEAASRGADLVLLLEEQPSAVKSGSSVSFSQFHFEMRLPLRSSRRRSPSHQTPKLHELGFFAEIFSPFTL